MGFKTGTQDSDRGDEPGAKPAARIQLRVQRGHPIIFDQFLFSTLEQFTRLNKMSRRQVKKPFFQEGNDGGIFTDQRKRGVKFGF